MRGIPATGGLPSETRKVVDALKENVEELRSVTSDKIKPLPSTATNADIINKINEILTRIQG